MNPNRPNRKAIAADPKLSPAAPLNTSVNDWPKGVVIVTSAFRDSDCCYVAFDRICRAGEPDVYVCRHCGGLCAPVSQGQDMSGRMAAVVAERVSTKIARKRRVPTLAKPRKRLVSMSWSRGFDSGDAWALSDQGDHRDVERERDLLRRGGWEAERIGPGEIVRCPCSGAEWMPPEGHTVVLRVTRAGRASIQQLAPMGRWGVLR